jgi:hypothetical protein
MCTVEEKAVLTANPRDEKKASEIARGLQQHILNFLKLKLEEKGISVGRMMTDPFYVNSLDNRASKVGVVPDRGVFQRFRRGETAGGPMSAFVNAGKRRAEGEGSARKSPRPLGAPAREVDDLFGDDGAGTSRADPIEVESEVESEEGDVW